MNKEKQNTDIKKKGWSNTLLTTSVFILLAVFTTFSTIESINNIAEIQYVEYGNVDDNVSFDDTDHFSDNFSHNPLHLPSDRNPYGEDKDEEDNLDEDEWSKSYSFYSAILKTDCNEISTKQSVKQFVQSVEKRTRISLFVLHHSWKTFLI